MRSRVLAALAVATLALFAMPAFAGATASDVYENTWPAADQWYGAGGQPSPYMTFASSGSNGYMWVTLDGNGKRRVYISPAAKTDLSGDDGSFAKKNAKVVLLHEWAHVYQADDLYGAQPSCNNAEEGGADLFAEHYDYSLVGLQWNGVYPASARNAFRNLYGDTNIAFKENQFKYPSRGWHWGQNPRTIGWNYQYSFSC